MKQIKSNKTQLSKKINYLICVCLSVFILGIFAPPFFSELRLPSIQQRKYIIYPEKGRLIQARRQSIIPFLGRNHIIAKIVWPKGIGFSEWYAREFAKISPSELQAKDNFVKVTLPFSDGGNVRITITLNKQIVVYSAVFSNP